MEVVTTNGANPKLDHINFFDYELTRNRYLESTKKIFEDQVSPNNPTTSKMIKFIIRKIKTNTAIGQRFRNKYEVIQDDFYAKNILILKRNSPNDPILQIVDYISAFDILADVHVNIHHSDVNEQLKVLRKGYWLYNDLKAINHLHAACNVCSTYGEIDILKENTQSNIHTEGVRVDVIAMTDKPDGDYTYILMYQKLQTEYILLRPLIEDDIGEISIELLKLFCDFGIPETLGVSSVSFYDSIRLVMLEVWPEIDFPAVSLVTDSGPYCAEIRKYLALWSLNTGSSNWAVGLCSVQWQLNNTPNEDDITPYMNLFGVESNDALHKPVKTNLCHVCKAVIHNNMYACTKCNKLIHLFCGERTMDKNVVQHICMKCSSSSDATTSSQVPGTSDAPVTSGDPPVPAVITFPKPKETKDSEIIELD